MGQKILFIIPYPLKESPSQRFRFEQYFEILTAAGHRYEAYSFLDSQNWQLFFKPGYHVEKAVALIKGFAKRLSLVIKSHQYDFVFIHREASPLGPPVIEWLLARVMRKKIIYDFDDAIWMTDRNQESGLLRRLKWRSKVARICSWSHKVSCGNAYLQRYALHFNSNAIINPTTIDTEFRHNVELYPSLNPVEELTIGWTGSHSTLKYLKELEHVLAKLLELHKNVKITIIADRQPSLCFPYTYIPWAIDREIADLLTFDIGIMPLPDDEWSKGKCGFKILQYLALQTPAVASPVGVNTQIIVENETGFLCKTESEWIDRLSELIINRELRTRLGIAGRKHVIEHYSVQSNSSNFLRLFT